MKTINNQIDGDITVDRDTNLTGMVTGDIYVTSATLNVRGMVNGNISIDEKATLILFGTINGNITIYGKCEIQGTVNGKIIRKTGDLVIDSNAVINDN